MPSLGKDLYLLLQDNIANIRSGWVCPAIKPIADIPPCFLVQEATQMLLPLQIRHAPLQEKLV